MINKVLLIISVLLVTSACVATPIAGDFCDVAEPIHFHGAVAEIIVQKNRDAAVKLDAQNRYGQKFCGW